MKYSKLCNKNFSKPKAHENSFVFVCVTWIKNPISTIHPISSSSRWPTVTNHVEQSVPMPGFKSTSENLLTLGLCLISWLAELRTPLYTLALSWNHEAHVHFDWFTGIDFLHHFVFHVCNFFFHSVNNMLNAYYVPGSRHSCY